MLILRENGCFPAESELLMGISLKPKTLNMTEGNIFKLIVSFAIPLLIGSLFQLLYNVVDSLVIGNFEGSIALAAVGIGHYPQNIVVNFFLGLGTGVTVLVSQAFGAGDEKLVKKVIDTANSMILVASPFLMLGGYLLTGPILRGMNTPDDTYAEAFGYLAVLFLGIMGTLGYNLNAGILRGMGDSISPLIFLIVACGVNIVLDLLFIGVFGWSAFGAGLATVIAQWVSWIYSILFINKKYPQYKLHMGPLVFHKDVFGRMMKIGLPLAFNSGLFALGHTMLSSLVNSHGTAFAAGYNVTSKLDSITWLSLNSFASAVTTFAGQNVGAGKGHRLMDGLKKGMILALLTTAFVSTCLTLPAPWLISLFDTNPAVVHAGAAALYRFVPYYVLYAVFYVLTCFFNGVGDVKIPFIANIVLFWVVRLPAAYLLSWLSKPEDLFFCYPISWIGGLLIVVPYFLSGRWKRLLKLPDEKKAIPEDGE